MLSCNNEFGYGAPMVDKLLGDAYLTVKSVADNLTAINAVGAVLNNSIVGDPMLSMRVMSVSDAVTVPGTPRTIPLPDLDLVLDHVMDSSVRIDGTDGAKYFADSGYFTTKLTSAGLVINLSQDAPSEVQNTTLNWFLTYKV